MGIIELERRRIELSEERATLKHQYETNLKALDKEIESNKAEINQFSAGLRVELIALGSSVLQILGRVDKGDDNYSVVADAIKDLATNGGTKLKTRYFGTKSYAQWYGQREDHEYNMGPKHGSMIFEVGLRPEYRTKDLTEQEIEASLYLLRNLRTAQQAVLDAVQATEARA